MERFRRADRRVVAAAIIIACLAVAGFLWREQLLMVIRLLLGGVIIAFIISPICRLYSRRLGRLSSVILSYVTLALIIMGVLFILIPIIVSQVREFAAAIPGIISTVEAWVGAFNIWLVDHGLSRLSFGDMDLGGIMGGYGSVLDGTVMFAGSIVSAFTELTMMLLLSYYFLRDKDRLLLHLELIVPVRARRIVVRMGAAIKYEMDVYLRGQLIIALIISVLSAFGLMVVGVRSFLLLGIIIGILNMIPYIGPFLGGVPAFLMALSQGIDVAVRALIVMFVVQQLDGMVIHPRVMGSVTGTHPAPVLIALMVGGSVGGIAGMLFAMPVLLAGRAIVRIWVNRAEKV